MKNLIATCALSAFALSVFVNCGKKDEPAKGAADMAATCYFMQTNLQTSGYGTQPGSAPCSYNYGATQGFSQANSGGGAFGMNSFNSYYGASSMCSAGQTMIYSPSKGLGCVSSNMLNMHGQSVIYDLNRTTMTFTQVSIATPYYQYTNQSYGYGYNNGYPNTLPTNSTNTIGLQVLRVCDAAEPCPEGQSCRSPLGPNTAPPVGVCYF